MARPSAASASPACGTAAATPRCRTPRRCASALKRDGTLVLYQGAVDIGQGSNTVLAQICADALGLPLAASRSSTATPTLTADAGKTSASRQTFVSGRARAPAARSCARDPAPGQRRPRRALAIDGPTLTVDGDAHDRPRRLPPSRGRTSARRGDLRPADHAARRRTARASPTPPTPSARSSRRSRSTPTSAR